MAKKTVAKRPRRVKESQFKQQAVTINTHQLFLRAVAELYPRDPSTPGIVTAYLPDKDEFYASLVRYEGPMGTGKQVLMNITAPTLESAINGLAQKWFDSTQAVRELRRAVIHPTGLTRAVRVPHAGVPVFDHDDFLR